MRVLYLPLLFCVAVSCASKKTTDSSANRSDTTIKTTDPVNEESGTVKRDTVLTKPGTTAVYPECIKRLISKFAAETPQNPRRKVISYTYKNSTVFYVPAVCCDNYSDLYDNACNLIGHPDGGFTGRGDGKIVDFAKQASNEKLLWEDRRN
jgi:hypothetical protein